MFKITAPAAMSVAILTSLFAPVSASAAILGPEAALCAAGNSPAMLVRVIGLKNRTGTLRLRSFGGSSATYFDKKAYLKRIQIDLPANGPVELCLPVPRPGVYAVDLRHDVNLNEKSDRADGAGASGNPKVSLIDIIFGKRPAASKVAVSVGAGVTIVPIVVKYLQGGSLKPIQTTAR